MSAIDALPLDSQAVLVRRAEVREVRDIGRLTTHRRLDYAQVAALRDVARNAAFYGDTAAVSIARHAASTARARSVELDDLIIARMGVNP